MAMVSRYVCLNGDFYLAGEAVFCGSNRAFAYGDALFETIHCLGTSAQAFDKHFARLREGMEALKMKGGDNFSEEILLKFIEKLLNKNRIFKGARIRITVFRNDGGLYTPRNNQVSWFMEAGELAHEKYELERAGLHMDIFDGIHKPVNWLSNLKTTNALIYVLAGIYCTENRLDDCFLLNQFGRITESISSNIFILLDGTLITPPLSEGCIAGTMRHRIIELALIEGISLEERGVLEKNLIEAEEVFLTNAIQGIKWISAYKDRRYFNFMSRKLIALLNRETFGS
jgi:branched-chain amino acid aminotransferase